MKVRRPSALLFAFVLAMLAAALGCTQPGSTPGGGSPGNQPSQPSGGGY